jgi:glycosyltransferase involved in cell wall biosynthesis
MQESELCFHHLEWPAPGEQVAGPVIWLRGWVTGKAETYFVDIRATCPTGVHLGILGLPRIDLATHFKSTRKWLPAEYIIGVTLPDGLVELSVEAMDEYGNWHRLQRLTLKVAPDGAPSPRVEGSVVAHTGGSSTVRVPHLPFHGHLDEPSPQPLTRREGRVEIFGWLLHETQSIESVFATIDGLVFNALESSLTDESLATKVPQHKAARHARVRGWVEAPPTITNPGCLRVYAKLADGSVALCFSRRLNLQPESSLEVPESHTPISPKNIKSLDALPSGRPRRLLLVVRSLRSDDATLRAWDVVANLHASGSWAVRLVASEDGPLHTNFEAAGCPVQIVDPQVYFDAREPVSSESALRSLGRQIWWGHLDAVALFDPASTWAVHLARQRQLPVFEDPCVELAWFSGSSVLSFDAKGELVAPIRGLSSQGAGVLLHAVDQLTRHHHRSLADRKVILTDLRDTSEERLFQSSVALLPTQSLVTMPQPSAAGAVICPAFNDHPHRLLLSALAAGVPVVSTPSPLLSRDFTENEVHFVPAGNPLALAHAIADLLANPVASQRRSAAATQLVMERHSPTRQLPRWRQLLEATAAG